MTALVYKGHSFTLIPTDALVEHAGLNLYCGKFWLLKITFDFSPTVPLHQWLDRAIELVNLLSLTTTC